jgi:type II secretory pathway component PulJ
MGAHTSFFNSVGAPFDVLSRVFGALPSQSQSSIRTVTRDETMVLHYDPLSKRESIEWRKPGKALPRKAKVTQSVKIKAMIFWD